MKSKRSHGWEVCGKADVVLLKEQIAALAVCFGAGRVMPAVGTIPLNQ